MQRNEFGKYIIAFLVTAGLFVTIFYVAKVVNEQKTQTVKLEQETIAIDLLSSEVQFSLLGRAGCDAGAGFASDLEEVGRRLAHLETTLGSEDQDVINLKKYYSLLELKDYLLTLEQKDRCGSFTPTILFFYSDACTECEDQSFALTALQERYDDLHVYSFDTDLDLSALRTLQGIYKVTGDVSTVVIKERKHEGFQSEEALLKLLPEMK